MCGSCLPTGNVGAGPGADDGIQGDDVAQGRSAQPRTEAGAAPTPAPAAPRARRSRRPPSQLEPIRTDGRAALARLGRQRRSAAPRRAHGAWAPSPGRPDPLVVIDATNARRVPDLVPIRWGRMLATPFTFLRGAPAVLASDLADSPVSGFRPQICGDAHCLNFGVFATPERHLVFDVNDFDETLPGPWEWDVKRLVASIAVAARVKGLSDDAARDAAIAAAAEYRRAMAQLAAVPVMDAWYTRLDVDELVAMVQDRAVKARMRKGVGKAQHHTSGQAFEKLTVEVDGERRIADRPPLIEHRVDRATGMHRVRPVFARYRDSLPDDRQRLLEQFQLVDVAFKVVGVGSVGTRCHVALFQGRATDEPLLLQVKEADDSVLSPFLGPSAYRHRGERVVQGQRLMQAASDLFLGWTSHGNVHFYVRQLRDMKFTINVDALSLDWFTRYGTVCAGALARAHSRSCDPSLVTGYLGGGDQFDRAMGSFSLAYADQTERDHAALAKAVKRGRIPAEIGA
ncbi:MAG: DUF2252 domain-containing protein [Acidimicrobiales bacterium]